MCYESTQVKVPLVVKVCIVLAPLVVIVPQVELADTQLLPSVLYDTITIPDHQALPLYVPAPPPPSHPLPVLAAQAFPSSAAFPHLPQAEYVTAHHDIELLLQDHHTPHTPRVPTPVAQADQAHPPHHPPMSQPLAPAAHPANQ